MLYKFWAAREFGESGDRIGVIEADSLPEATARLGLWLENQLYSGEFELIEPANTTYEQDGTIARVTCHLQDLSANPDDTYRFGTDEFVIAPATGGDGKVVGFLAEDWSSVFSLPANN